MKRLIADFDPMFILSLGLAGNAKTIQIETFGLNLKINPEATYPVLTLRKVNQTGPWIQQATYDIPKIISQIREENIAVEQSYSAGLYLCNAILYETLFYQTETARAIPTGFIHVPQLNTQHPDGMHLEDMITAVHSAISAQIS